MSVDQTNNPFPAEREGVFLRCESDLKVDGEASVYIYGLGKELGVVGIRFAHPSAPRRGATNSMNDTGVSIVSFPCAMLLNKFTPRTKK